MVWLASLKPANGYAVPAWISSPNRRQQVMNLAQGSLTLVQTGEKCWKRMGTAQLNLLPCSPDK